MKIDDHLTKLLSRGNAGNQAMLVELLAKEGIKTTQSTVSRALKRMNAVKGMDENGETVYSLSKPPATQGLDIKEKGLFGSLVHKILDNGQMIVVHTRPGTAPTIAKVIDDHDFEQVIGTVAGDDTILVIPADVRKTRQVSTLIRAYLSGVGLY